MPTMKIFSGRVIEKKLSSKLPIVIDEITAIPPPLGLGVVWELLAVGRSMTL